MTTTLLIADALFPVDRPPILGDAAIAFREARILAVGNYPDLHKQFPNAEEIRLPAQTALLPGLINAHTHLELGYLRGKIPPSHFVDWVKQLMTHVSAQTDLPAVVAQSIRKGIRESLRSGVTTLGDITKQVAISRPILKDSPARIVSFGEIQAIGTRRTFLDERLAASLDASCASDTLSIAVSPHAPYTVDGIALRKIVVAASSLKLPICIHLAEMLEEREFLNNLSGRIREPYELLGALSILDQSIPLTPDGPIVWAKTHGLFDTPSPVVLAHVNYASEDDLKILAATKNASVAYCPRTRTFFGHDEISPHPYREMLELGINVALGTDSLASNPDLSLLREAQLLHRRDGISAGVLLNMLTRNGAKALGMEEERGTLGAGKTADIAAFPYEKSTDAETILASIVGNSPTAYCVWVRRNEGGKMHQLGLEPRTR